MSNKWPTRRPDGRLNPFGQSPRGSDAAHGGRSAPARMRSMILPGRGYILRKPGRGAGSSSASDLFAAKRILETTDGVLHFARHLVGLAFGFELGIARRLDDRFLDGALGLLGHAFDSILIHL